MVVVERGLLVCAFQAFRPQKSFFLGLFGLPIFCLRPSADVIFYVGQKNAVHDIIEELNAFVSEGAG
jgi:hypothetical protein